MLTGIVKFFVEYGYITPHDRAAVKQVVPAADEKRDVFFHRTDIQQGAEIKNGSWVTFALIPGYVYPPNGCPRVESGSVALCAPKKPRSAPAGVVPINGGSYGTD